MFHDYKIINPLDTSLVFRGAGDIRDSKESIEERMVIDHQWGNSGTSNNDGYHKKLTISKALSPSAKDGAGILYVRDCEKLDEALCFNGGNGEIQINSVAMSYASDLAERSTSSLSFVFENNLLIYVDVVAGGLYQILLLGFFDHGDGQQAISIVEDGSLTRETVISQVAARGLQNERNIVNVNHYNIFPLYVTSYAYCIESGIACFKMSWRQVVEGKIALCKQRYMYARRIG